MTVPLHDRLIQIVVTAILDGGPLGDHASNIADALIASEDWQAREAVVEAARVLAGIGTGQQTQGGQHLLAKRSAWLELRAALARLDAGRGKEPDNHGS